MNKFGKSLLALSLFGVITGTAQAQEKVLHVYNWSDYIGETTLADFQKATGIKTRRALIDHALQELLRRERQKKRDHPAPAESGRRPAPGPWRC